MILDKLHPRQWLRKSIVGFSILTLIVPLFLSLSNKSFAADYDWIKVYPEHIGIFTTVGVQQFVAFGYKNDGTRANITKKVDWISSNKNIISIDKNGLATIVTGITSGQVKITCSYPKTGNIAPGVNLLLLKKNRYTVTPSAGANGAISPSTAQKVVDGETTTFTVTPDTGYSTASVTGTCGGNLTGTTYTTNPITDDCTVDATFVINTYTLTYTAGANGTITGTTPQTVDYGTDGTAVTASPDTGYHFVDWSDASTANPRTDTGVTSDVTVTANFAINTYSVTPSTTGNGVISPSTVQTADYNTTVSFTLTPVSGYTLIDVTGTCAAGDPATDNGDGSWAYTTGAVTADCTVIANFTN